MLAPLILFCLEAAVFPEPPVDTAMSPTPPDAATALLALLKSCSQAVTVDQGRVGGGNDKIKQQCRVTDSYGGKVSSVKTVDLSC